MNQFKKWQAHGISKGKRLAALLLAALLFPTGIPAILVLLLPKVDRAFGIGSFSSGTVNIVVGASAVLLGGALAFWTIGAQIVLASGTPLPMLPTQKLLISGPFHYCRNPMILGTVLAYAGAAIWVGSYTALFTVLVIAALLLVYVKLIEEKELEMRFGQEYAEYKKNTPFLFPRRIGKAEKRVRQGQ